MYSSVSFHTIIFITLFKVDLKSTTREMFCAIVWHADIRTWGEELFFDAFPVTSVKVGVAGVEPDSLAENHPY